MDGHRRHYRNDHVMKWLCALAANRGSLLVNALEQERRGLFHLGALWARQRGYIRLHGTVDVISANPRRYAFTLTPKGARIVNTLKKD